MLRITGLALLILLIFPIFLISLFATTNDRLFTAIIRRQANIRLTRSIIIISRRSRRSGRQLLLLMMMMVVMKVILISHLLRSVDELFLLGSFLKNFNIRDDHDGAGDPKADRARDQRVGNIDYKLALVGKAKSVGDGLVGRVEARKDGYAGDEDGTEPDGPDHNVNSFGGNLHRVVERLDDSIVAVVADTA